ncbi:MAG: tripartite tricarboxylate transporter substrate binding protein [Alphaproteobacteria bacterium]|nr:MAG: tripartite tricarboxylate transporter substrate binding protein [Alphaproteobacteria bacterium]
MGSRFAASGQAAAEASRHQAMAKRYGAAAIVSVLALALLGAAAHAQDWPARPVRLIAPYAAGGNSDGIARITAQRLTEALGQTFVVENRLGGNGALAAEAVARAAPDGYTLLWGATPPLTINPALTKLSYDPVRDFAPISVVGTNAFVLVVNKDFPPRTVAEFISYVRAQPGKLAYAEGSAGSITHLGMALFLHRAGLAMTNVSYRGNAPALTDVMAGHLPTMLSNISDAMPQAAAGFIRLLAVSSEQRAPQLPDVPTIAESGFPGFNVLTWNGLLAPAGTPNAILAKIAGETARMVKDPQFVARLEQYGADPVGNTPEQFAAMIGSETALWADAVKSLGLKF